MAHKRCTIKGWHRLGFVASSRDFGVKDEQDPKIAEQEAEVAKGLGVVRVEKEFYWAG